MNAYPFDPTGLTDDEIIEAVVKEPLLLEIGHMKDVTLIVEEQSTTNLLEDVKNVKDLVSKMYLYVRNHIMKEDEFHKTNENNLPRKYMENVGSRIAKLRARLEARDKEWGIYIAKTDDLCDKIIKKQTIITQLSGVIPSESQLRKFSEFELRAIRQENSWMEMQQPDLKVDLMMNEGEELHDKMRQCIEEIQKISNDWMIINALIEVPSQ